MVSARYTVALRGPSFAISPAQQRLERLPEIIFGCAGRGHGPPADVRFLEPPMDLPPITEMLWWNPRRTMDPAHAWLRARIAEIAAELDQPAVTAGPVA